MHLIHLAAALDRALDRIAAAPGRRDQLSAILLLAPAALVLAAFTLGPFLGALILSLQHGRYGALRFAGLDNYHEALTSPEFWNSVLVTAYYILGAVPATLSLAFLVSFALHRTARFQRILRTVYFLPYITSVVAAAMIWRALLNTELGVMNHLFQAAGLAPQQWLLEARSIFHLLLPDLIPANAGPSLALCCVIAFDVWHNTGFAIVVLLAGFAAMPRELEEAAAIDGANGHQLIRHIYIPTLTPMLLFLAIVSTAGAFQAFNSFYALTYGGNLTLGTTDNMMIYLYRSFYEYGRWGYGSAIAVLLSAFIAVLSWVQWRVGRSRDIGS